ncbi:DUF3298 and DUF4163 domain-containing protein [Brevibacillus sp. NRS-1366]|uniref:DUF3298 and DUF4163 domain-containing protein n=1 Tax=Brevibacillus sp. NRS-1366 TaxID=3233899 RepID=UPI003D1B3D3E
MSSLKVVASSLLGTVVLLTSVAVPAFAAPAAVSPAKPSIPAVQVQKPQTQGVVFTPKTILSNTKEHQIKVVVPVISGLQDKAFEAQLNATLLKQAQDTIAHTQQGARENAADAKKYGYDLRPYALDISYEVHSTGKLVSFSVQTYVYTGGAHGMTDVTYYTIANQPKAKQLTLADLFQPGYDYRSILNHLISAQIKEQNTKEGMEIYSFESISDNQSFSFENGNLVIHFGQYEIAPYAAGMPSFTIAPHRFHNLLKPEIGALLK